ncbi:MAG: hypothetical protein MJ171_06940, partial [Clostridia bacterium]|nr:hypothetical protein [Clostridia bacterium]
VVTAGSDLIDGQYIGAITAVDRSSAVTLNIRVNGTLSLYGKNGILAGCTKEKDFNTSHGDTYVKINGKGNINIYAESAGITAKSPRLFSGSTYKGGVLSVDENVNLNILLSARNSRATGIDIGNVPGFSVYVKGNASLAVSTVNGVGINRDAAMQYAVLSKDPAHETYGNLKGSWYLAVPEGKLESGTELYSPNSYSVISSIGTNQEFNFDIDNAYVRENPCLTYRLTFLTADASTNAGFALVGSADDRELKCSYTLKKAGPQVFDMGVAIYPAYVSSTIKEVHETLTFDVNGEHNHNWILVSNSATCVNAGEMKWTCSICSEGKSEAVSALGHLYPKEWYDNGKEHYRVCIRCNETTDKGEHKWVKGVAKHMSCTENVYPYTCSVCKAKKEETEKQNGQHKFSAYRGNESGHWRTCTVCGYSETGSHKFETTSWGEILCSACKWGGKTGGEDIYCNVSTVCPHITAEIDISRLSAAHRDRIKNGDYESMRWYNNGNNATIKSDTLKYKTSTGDMGKYNKYDGLLEFMIIFNENDYDLFAIGLEWVSLKKLPHVNGYPATCDTEGVKEHYICACGKAIDKNYNVIDIKIPKLKHSYDDVCDATCNLCGATRNAEHDFETVWTVKDKAHFHKCKKCGVQKDYELCIASGWTMEKEAGCTEAGHAYQSCIVCGTKLAEKDIPNAHEFTDWAYLNGADCTTSGEMKRECLKCGAEETMLVVILGHRISYDE